MQAATTDMFEEVDRQLLQLARVATTPARPAPRAVMPQPVPRAPVKAPGPACEMPPAEPKAAPVQQAPRRSFVIAGAVVAMLGLGLIATANILHLIGAGQPLTGKAAVDSVVSRILVAESRGAIDPKNARSSAAGPAQFLDETWLEMIRAYRPDLMKGRTRDEILALRRRPGLARQIAMRFAERNAALLKRRGLPVTAGTLYLAHFAGAAGAAALLKAPPHADAAGVMALADASGKTRREQIVKANPFLDNFTVDDIKRWADRKMEGPTLVLTELLSANARK